MSIKYAEPEYKELGRVLKEAVNNKHTQAVLGQQLFVSQVAVNHWLLGYRRPAPAHLGQLAAILNLCPDELISLADYDDNPDAYEKTLNAYRFRRAAMGGE